MGASPLHYAALAGQVPVVDLLCRRVIMRGIRIDDIVQRPSSNRNAFKSLSQFQNAVTVLRKQLDEAVPLPTPHLNLTKKASHAFFAPTRK